MASSPYRSWVEISLPQVAANYETICRAVGPGVDVMPVVKADAYRHGALEISRVLTHYGVRSLAVSNVEEGVLLREGGIDAKILVMADFLPAGRSALLEHQLTPVIHDLADIPELDALASRRGAQTGFHLKIDTGMCRLGTRATAAEIFDTVRDCRHVRLEGLMTHFASVADFAKAQAGEQEDCFFELLAGLRTAGLSPEWIHLSSTGGIAYRGPAAWGNLVRPGHAIYGYVSPARGPAPSNLLRVSPVLTWKAAVLAVKDIPEGSLVGYGGMFRAPKPLRTAVVAAGYADGVPHRLSNRGKVLVRGALANILGAVSMDLTTIDVSHCPDVQVGDAVTLLGQEGDLKIDAQDIAKVAGTISYNVLCGISARVKRVYIR